MPTIADRKIFDAGLAALRAATTPTIPNDLRSAFYLHALAGTRKRSGPHIDPITTTFHNALVLRDRCGFNDSGIVEPWWIAGYLLSAGPNDRILLSATCPNDEAFSRLIGSPLADARTATIAIHDTITITEPATPLAQRVLRFWETGAANAVVRLPGAVIEIDDPSMSDFIEISIAAYEPAEIAKLTAIPRRAGESRAATEVKTATYAELTPIRRDSERRTVSTIYDAYEPRRAIFAGAKAHPADLIESKTFASINPPPLKNILRLEKSLIDSGVISSAQLEVIAIADSAHSKIAPTGLRYGFYLGDGTGVGKTNEQLGLYLNNYNYGRRRMIYITEKSKHFENVEKAVAMLGLPRRLLIDAGAYSSEDTLPNRDGIVFITYTRLRESEDDGDTFPRIDQLVNWMGKETQGLIVFDECHNLRNAVSDPNTEVFTQPASLQGRAGLVIQDAMPNARILYASATGISDLYNLAYMTRLGLWGPGTEFKDLDAFLGEIHKSGVSGLELIASHLAASGLMLARTLSLEGVRAETLMHHFSDAEITNWDRLADLLATLRNALPDAWCSALRKARTKKFDPPQGWSPQEANAHFESASRRLAELALVSAATPTVIKDMKMALERGEAPIVQLTNTYEAEAESGAATFQATIKDLIQRIIPTCLVQKIKTQKSTRLKAFAPIQDDNGNPIPIPENIALCDRLLELSNQLFSPRPPLDQIIEAFGAKAVAEITGRSRRRVFDPITGAEEIEVRNATAVRADLSAFMSDRKQMLVFSTGAGGSSMDYHAAKDVRNRRLRRHYLLQPGPRADQALQGAGRSHRSNQEQPPVIVLVTTDLPAEIVYTSRTFAKIQMLGASTQGHREANSATFNRRKTYESEYARAAFVRFFDNLSHNTYPDLSCAAFEQATHMKLIAGGKAAYTADAVFFRRALSRLARCNLTTQRAAFSHIDHELEETLSKAIVDRTFDTGPEYISEQVEVLNEKVLLTEHHTGATITATTISGAKHAKLLTLDEAIAEAETYDILGRPIRWAWSPDTMRPFIQVAVEEDQSGYVKLYRIIEPERSRTIEWSNDDLMKSERVWARDRMDQLWDFRIEMIEDLASKPSVILSGALPLIYGALSTENGLRRPVIADTTDGRRLMGVLTTPDHAATIAMSAKKTAMRIESSSTVSAKVDEILDYVRDGKTVVFSNNWMVNTQMCLAKMRTELHVPSAEKKAVEKAARTIGFTATRFGSDVRFLLPEDGKVRDSIQAILSQADILRIDNQPDWKIVA